MDRHRSWLDELLAFALQISVSHRKKLFPECSTQHLTDAPPTERASGRTFVRSRTICIIGESHNAAKLFFAEQKR